MENKVPSFLLERPASDSFSRGRKDLRTPFVDKGLHYVADVIKAGYVQWETASKDDFFQKIDARIKVLSLLFFVIIVSLKKEILPELLIAAFVFVLMLLARLNIVSLYKRIFFLGFMFGFLVALPSAFNVITRGEVILPLFHLSHPHSFWVYRFPEEIGLTREGLLEVSMLTVRVMNSLALTFFVLSTTSFPDIIKALKVLKIPDGFLMIVTLSYKYVFIFAKTVEDMHLAKKSRQAGRTRNAEARRWITGRIAFLFKRTMLRCEEIFKSMTSRGFSGDIKIYGTRKLTARDWSAGAAFLIAGVLFLWI